MKVSEFRFFAGLSLVARSSGALIAIEDFDLNQLLDPHRLAQWLVAFPARLMAHAANKAQPLHQEIPWLLLTLTEQARLYQAEVRVLDQGTHRLRLWLPVDDQGAAQAALALTQHVVVGVLAGANPDATTARLWRALRGRFWNQTHAHLAVFSHQVIQ